MPEESGYLKINHKKLSNLKDLREKGLRKKEKENRASVIGRTLSKGLARLEVGFPKTKLSRKVSEEVTAKDTHLQIQEVQWASSWMNTKKAAPKYILFKVLKSKNKEKIVEAARRKMTCYIRRKIIWKARNFSLKQEVRGQGKNSFKVLSIQNSISSELKFSSCSDEKK